MQERSQNNGTKGEHEEKTAMRSGRQSMAMTENAGGKTENAEETTENAEETIVMTTATVAVEDTRTGIGSDDYSRDPWLQ